MEEIMTLNHLMSIKNSKVLVKTLSYEGAEDLLMMNIQLIGDEISVLREGFNEVDFILKNGSSTVGLQYAELELEEIQLHLHEKSHQWNHIHSLLEDLQRNMFI